MLRGALVLGGLAAAYLLCAGQVSGTEALAGLGATLLAGGYVLALGHSAERRLRLAGVPWGRVLASSFGAAPRQTLQVAWAVLCGSGGARAVRRFEAGGAGSEDAGRRAMVTLALSLAPNGFVTRVDADRLRMHMLAARDEARQDGNETDGSAQDGAARRWPL